MQRVIEKVARGLMSYKTLRRIFCLLMIVAFCGAAMGASRNRQNDDDKKPKFELKGIACKGFDLANKTAEVVATVDVKNAGGAFKLKDVNYKLRLNDQEVAEGKYEKDLEIPATGEATFELPFTVELTSIPGVAWNAIGEAFTLRYELETEFTIPLFATLKHTQKTSFKGDLPIGEAFSSLSNKLKEKLFGKP
jgi:LEA14-like dessication related protein